MQRLIFDSTDIDKEVIEFGRLVARDYRPISRFHAGIRQPDPGGCSG